MKKIQFLKTGFTYALILSIILGLSVAVYFSGKSDSVPTSVPIRETESGVMLTFNVYQGSDEVNKIIDVLCAYGIQGTFFLGGCWVDKNPETVHRIVENGFTVGSHGYYHYDHSKMDYQKNFDEIKKSIDCIESVTNKKITLFAPPSGAYNDSMMKACENLDLKVIMWSKDTIDWRDQDVDLLVERATKNIKDKDIILMHPTKATVLALPKIIENIQTAGYKFV